MTPQCAMRTQPGHPGSTLWSWALKAVPLPKKKLPKPHLYQASQPRRCKSWKSQSQRNSNSRAAAEPGKSWDPNNPPRKVAGSRFLCFRGHSLNQIYSFSAKHDKSVTAESFQAGLLKPLLFPQLTLVLTENMLASMLAENKAHLWRHDHSPRELA